MLRELPVKLFVLSNYCSKSKKSWCNTDDIPPDGTSAPIVQAHSTPLGSESPTYCAPTKVTSPPTHQLSPRLLPSRQPPVGSLNNSQILASDHRDLSHLSSPTGYIYSPPAPTLPARVYWEHIRKATLRLRLRPVCHVPSTTPSLFAPSPINLLCCPNAGSR